MPISQLFAHAYVRIALAVAAVIALGSGAYFVVATRAPALNTVAVVRGSVSADVVGSGVISPAENPDLSFVSGGRVANVYVKVGQKVSAGEVLAALDTGVLSANLASAQAKLQELEAGPRAVDLAGLKTALQQAQTSLPESVRDAEAQAEVAVAKTDELFTTPNTAPRLTSLLIRDIDSKIRVEGERRDINQELLDWRTEVAVDPSPQQALEHLSSIAAYLNDLTSIINNAKTTSDADAATLSGYSSDVNTARSTVSNLSLSITDAQSAVRSAQDKLALTQAGARPEDIAVQRAAVDAAAAQVRQSEVIAPFAGTVGSVAVKVGDVVAPNTLGISLVPQGALELPIYVSEIEVTKLTVGEPADITLDAYGAGRAFPATVAVIDTAPTAQTQGLPTGYKVTLAFARSEQAVSVGMHGNATIHGGSKADVLVVPRSALLQEGAQSYVLKQTASGVVKTPVELGLVGSGSVEIVSGLAEGDRIVLVGTH